MDLLKKMILSQKHSVDALSTSIVQVHHTQLLISFTNATFQVKLDLFSYRYTSTHLNIAHLFLLLSLRREEKKLAEIVHYHERHFGQEVVTG